MKGIILAGGSGTRLRPITTSISKQIVPVYDKPMLYYPLSTLMLAGLTEILIITTARDMMPIQTLIGDGRQLGLDISYAVQDKPEGIAQALIIAEPFLDGSSCCLILGDNIFYGQGLRTTLNRCKNRKNGASVLAYHIKNPERYGVVEFDENNNPSSLIEKPKKPKSNWAVTGIYFYDNRATEISKSLKPSKRGELEITDLNKYYLNEGKLHVERMSRGMAWLDTGTPDSLLEAAEFIQTIEKRQGLKIACIEEIAYYMGFIGEKRMGELAKAYKGSNYGDYLYTILKQGVMSVS
jgi:glucose-1-phosphate thymidylyltransferase